ncbi:hypothetical protein EDB87DRAFT_1586471 [Lactarius vividus]|nr:hypothetical protein EDB87DRAFT_1586471 [Lactarius vividus]
MAMSDNATTGSGSNKAIKAIDSHSVHRITSGQVVIDLQTAAKELVENALDAEVRFKDYGLKSIEVIDNGSGIAPEDYESIALKHYTSKLDSFSDLTSVLTFGFSVTTATSTQAPMGTVLTFDSAGRLTSQSGKTARQLVQRGTTVAITGLFKPLPVRRKEFERHAKREFGKALHLLTAYALVPCTRENNGVVLTVSHTPNGGKKTAQLRTDGAASIRASVGALWGPKQLENLVDLRLSFEVVPEKVVLRRREEGDVRNHQIRVEGLISKFAPGAGRTGTDRQFFFINGRPCAPAKVQKAINEVYRTFNANQSPFVIADFILPTDSCDINVSPDKRTILLHSENNLIESLKLVLTEAFDNTRSSFVLNSMQVALAQKERELPPVEEGSSTSNEKLPLFIPDDQDDATGTEQAGDVTTGGQNGKIASKGDSVDLPVEKEPDNTSPPSDEPHPVQKRPRLASPDPVSDEETRPIKKVAAARSPSPEPASVPAPLIAAPQRLAGPGRTPARVEQILSTNTSCSGRGVQMVLDTSGASWNLKPGHEGPQRKRPHLADVSGSSSGKNARTSMRARLAGFARDGVHVVRDKDDEDSPEEEEGAEDEVVEVKRVSKKVDTDDEAGEKVSSSTDVVDETMIVDCPDSHDSVPKSKPKSKARHTARGATASPSAKQSDDAELASNEELLLLEDSPSDSEPPSNAAAATTSSSHDATSGIRTEVLRTVVGDAPPLAFDLERTTSAWSAYLERRAAPTPPPAPHSSDLEHADLAADNENATATLARVLSKADFQSMHVVGQFNRGFIVARLRKTDAAGATDDDLFIVDQHAADEKYNFETLQATTRLESQRLFTPRVLELTAADELVALENMGVLQQNGFEVAVEEDQPAGRRLSLVAQPVSKNTEFDTQDLEEILHLLRDRPAGTLVRSSKMRAMFAMRACRKSTMVGESLNAKQMTSIIRHMGTMEQPWNCPHGRPTMRHLSDVGMVEKREWRPVDWARFIPR